MIEFLKWLWSLTTNMNLANDFETQSIPFTVFLRHELSRRIQKNPKYSLRSFARDLNIPLSSLSMTLSGDRAPSKKFITKVSSKLNISPVQTRHFLMQNVTARTAESDCESDLILREDQFKIILDWRHFAILRLLKTSTFKPDFNWIAKRLNSNPFHIEECVDRLKRLSLLKSEENKWTDTSNGKTSYLKTKHTDENIKSFLKNMLEKSIQSIDQDDISERNHTGMMLTISKKSLPLAIDLIKNFRRTLTEILEDKSIEKDEVYYLDIGFFPLTKTINTKEKINDIK